MNWKQAPGMNNPPDLHASQSPSETEFGNRLLVLARSFSYPPTPDVSRSVARSRTDRYPGRSRRGLVLAIAVLVLVLAVGFAVPPVRAAVLNWIRIGAVQIFLRQPVTPSPQDLTAPAISISPQPRGSTAPILSASPTPLATIPPVVTPSVPPLTSILDLSGEVSLANAQSQANFPIRLPTYPSDLGQPDHVYFQDIDMGGGVVILVWMDPTHPNSVRQALSETVSAGIVFKKILTTSVTETTVAGQSAIWVDGPYLLNTLTAGMVTARLVDAGHTLVWTQADATYRLETDTDLDTAIHIAESLR
jgi:hypothetical protein